VTLTDAETGVGLWIRYTMQAPLPRVGEPATAALWFVAMDPKAQSAATFARKATFPITEMNARAEPFELRIGDATLRDDGVRGALDGAQWDLRWTPAGRAYEHVHPVLRPVASTILVLAHADLAVEGAVSFGERRLELRDARAGQAHLWGAKHAASWAWAHCNDFCTLGGEPVPGAFVDAVSATVPRLGHELGSNTPVVGRLRGEDFRSTSPLRVLANGSRYGLTGWRFAAVAGGRKLIGEVDADRRLLAGVTYHDPDGAAAYCYNTETASMRVHVYERARRVGGWELLETLVSRGRAHFEYGAREPVPELELLTR
jgi:hypothetical protein